jgi:hypothetical protein
VACVAGRVCCAGMQLHTICSACWRAYLNGFHLEAEKALVLHGGESTSQSGYERTAGPQLAGIDFLQRFSYAAMEGRNRGHEGPSALFNCTANPCSTESSARRNTRDRDYKNWRMADPERLHPWLPVWCICPDRHLGLAKGAIIFLCFARSHFPVSCTVRRNSLRGAIEESSGFGEGSQGRFDTRSWFQPCLEGANIASYVWHSNHPSRQVS